MFASSHSGRTSTHTHTWEVHVCNKVLLNCGVNTRRCVMLFVVVHTQVCSSPFVTCFESRQPFRLDLFRWRGWNGSVFWDGEWRMFGWLSRPWWWWWWWWWERRIDSIGRFELDGAMIDATRLLESWVVRYGRWIDIWSEAVIDFYFRLNKMHKAFRNFMNYIVSLCMALNMKMI